MEGRSLIDGLAGWGPNSAEVLSGHPAAHPRNKSSLDQPSSRAGSAGPARRYSTKARLGVSHPNSRRATLFDWLLVACPCCPWHGPETGVRHSSAAVLPAVPGPWGSNQAMIKVLPGRPSCQSWTRRADWPTGPWKRLWPLWSLAWWHHKQRQVSVIEMSGGQGNSLTAAG